MGAGLSVVGHRYIRNLLVHTSVPKNASMSYKSLLFCSDEKTARLVTQVLSELDFTVELAVDTYATAKKLAEEHFDALVVDCQNEQDASLLFKAARNSTENHSSLSVAVVDGQAGVAKAFRIGANLVLTKPINVEQSKSTLRVARGLLKKNQAKPVDTAPTAQPTPAFAIAKPAAPAEPAFSAAAASLSSGFSPAAGGAPTEPGRPSGPYESLEVEKEPTPSAEAADLAVLESMPQLPVTKAEPPVATPRTMDKPFVVGSSAAAAAPAIEKKIVERQAIGMSPLVTNEPIVKESTAPSTFENHVAVPTFSTLERAQGSGGGKGALKMIVALIVLGAAFYLGWQKLPGMLHRSSSANTAATPVDNTPEKTEAPAAQPNTAAPTSAPVATQPAAQGVAGTAPATNEPAASNAAEQIAATTATTQSSPDDIQVQEMPLSRDTKVTVTPKAQPLIVKNGAVRRPAAQAAAPVAPSISVADIGSNSPISDLVTSDAPLPKPAPGTVRISQGVSQGLLMKKVAPAYPAIAIQLHKEGTVEMLATVSKEGRIANIKVLNGDGMLTRAATDAVKQWQYRPYLLNGQPVEVETQISISFKLPK